MLSLVAGLTREQRRTPHATPHSSTAAHGSSSSSADHPNALKRESSLSASACSSDLTQPQQGRRLPPPPPASFPFSIPLINGGGGGAAMEPSSEDRKQSFLRAARAVASSTISIEELLAFPKSGGMRGLGGGTGVWKDVDAVAERFIRDVIDRQKKQRLAALRGRMQRGPNADGEGEREQDRKPVGGGLNLFPNKGWGAKSRGRLLYQANDVAAGAAAAAGAGNDEGEPPRDHKNEGSSSSCSSHLDENQTSSKGTMNPIPPPTSHHPTSPPPPPPNPPLDHSTSLGAAPVWGPLPSLSSSSSTSSSSSSSSLGDLFVALPHIRYTHPSRLLGLYGPGTLLPHLPQYLRDTISFNEAHRHAAFLRAQLHPQGFTVAITGSFRCGAPQAEALDMLIALRDDRLRQYIVSAAESQVDRLWEPQSTAPPSMTADLLRAASPFYEKRLRRACERALEGLHRIGYLVACKNSKHLRWTKQNTTLDGSGCVSMECVARIWSDEGYAFHGKAFRAAFERSPMHFADGCPTTAADAWLEEHLLKPPPLRLTDPAKLLSVRLHTVRLHFTPTALFHIQQFFRTGPPGFTALLTMAALQRGKRLYADGLFAPPPSSATATPQPVVQAQLPASAPILQRDDYPHVGLKEHEKHKKGAGNEKGGYLDAADEEGQAEPNDDCCPADNNRHGPPPPLPPSTSPSSTSSSSSSRGRKSTNRPSSITSFQPSRGVAIPVESEECLFEHAGMPYVHPVNRAIYMQLRRHYHPPDRKQPQPPHSHSTENTESSSSSLLLSPTASVPHPSAVRERKKK